MQLKYRGVSYEYNPPPITISESKEVGKYRGVALHFHKLIKFLPQPSLNLKYRGVSYHTGSTA